MLYGTPHDIDDVTAYQQRVFHMSFVQNQTSPDGQYLQPDNTTAVMYPDCAFSAESSVIRSDYEFQLKVRPSNLVLKNAVFEESSATAYGVFDCEFGTLNVFPIQIINFTKVSKAAPSTKFMSSLPLQYLSCHWSMLRRRPLAPVVRRVGRPLSLSLSHTSGAHPRTLCLAVSLPLTHS